MIKLNRPYLVAIAILLLLKFVGATQFTNLLINSDFAANTITHPGRI